MLKASGSDFTNQCRTGRTDRSAVPALTVAAAQRSGSHHGCTSDAANRS